MGLKIENIIKTYPDFKIELDLSIHRGELLTLLGPSGCGKTTSLRLIAGFIQPDSGQIFMGTRLLNPLPPHLREIGIVFQDYALFPNLNVMKNIAFGPQVHGWKENKIRERVQSLLKLVHLEGYGNRKVTRISGGEQQRVALARALAPDPRLLLLDEPLCALDTGLRKVLRKDILKIQKELQITALYITHDQEEALAISDRIAVMQNGRIEQIGTPQEIYEGPRSLFVAEFIGQANIIKGIIKGFQGRYAQLQTPIGLFKAPYSAPPDPVIGAEAILFFRPEHCRIQEHHDNCIRGYIESCEYIGEYNQLQVKAKEFLLTLKLRDFPPPPKGSEIEFRVNPDNCRLLGDAGSSGYKF